MLQTLVDNGLHMVVGKGIKHGLPLPAGFDQPGVFQRPQLVGDGGLGHAQKLRNVAHAYLRLKQDVQNPNPGGITENPEQLRQIVQGVLVRQILLDFLDNMIYLLIHLLLLL